MNATVVKPDFANRPFMGAISLLQRRYRIFHAAEMLKVSQHHDGVGQVTGFHRRGHP
jgi:hypothetical protein